MNLAELVFDALTTGSDGLRAHHNKLPKKGEDGYVLPMAVITTIGGHNERHLRGDGGLRRRVVRVDIWGASRKLADDAMEVALTKMDAASTFKVAAVEDSGAPGYDFDANLWRSSFDFTVWFNQ